MKYTQSFDTLNIKLPIALVNSIKVERFKAHETAGGIQVQQLGAKDLRSIHGLNLIRVNEAAGEVILGLSAKILGHDYPKMLNVATIPTALDKVRSTGLLSFDTAAVMAAAEPLLIHAAKDLQLLHCVPDYTRVWRLLHVNTTYSIHDFRNENSLTFAKKVSTKKAMEYAKLYDKARELELPQNKEFRESLSSDDLTNIRTYFRGKARLECELKSITKIRQYYGLHPQQPVKLSDVLESDRNPINIMYDRITAHVATQPEAAEERLFFTELTAEEQTVMGQCKLFDYDLEQVKALCFQNVSRPTRSKKLKAAAMLVSRLRAQQGGLRHPDFQLLDELRQQVAA